MKLVPQLAEEFEGVCAHYSQDPRGRDVVHLAKKFMEQYEHFDQGVSNAEYTHAWDVFLSDHTNIITVQQVGVVIYVLLTYWVHGQRLFENMPRLEKMLLRDTWFEMQDEMERQSALNGRLLQPKPE